MEAIIDPEPVIPSDGSLAHRFQCLDMVNIEWSPGIVETAIVLEIWSDGAIFNTSSQILPNSHIKICVKNGTFYARVVSCNRDLDFGFLIEIHVVRLHNDIPEDTGSKTSTSNEWFPRGYMPAWTLPAQPAIAETGYFC